MFGFFGRKSLKIESRSICDRGLVRKDNQDCLLEDAVRAVFCVADGMGGERGGAMASRMVCESVGAASLPETDFERRILNEDAALVRVNHLIREQARRIGCERMGSTVALLMIDPTEPAQAAIANAGDSRIYRRRGVRFECMTEDHRNSAYSHLLTKAVGAADALEPDWVHASVMPGDIWLLCTDGVHEMLPNSTINALIAHGGNVSDIAERIGTCVRRAGARDNYSIIVIRT